MAQNNLKSCPFCGSVTVELRKREEIDGHLNTVYTRVVCLNCGGSSCEKFSNEDAIMAWNRRITIEIPVDMGGD